MRAVLTILIAGLLACAGCSKGSDAPTTDKTVLTDKSLGIDWPRGAAGWPAAPASPAGFDPQLAGKMADILVPWAVMATTEQKVWKSKDAVKLVAASLPAASAKALTLSVKTDVSPRLAVANVFADDVTIIGLPRVTAAWEVSTGKDDTGKPFMQLKLQTRAAYEVKVDGGPTRVIGMLRVQGLTAYKDTSDDYGLTAGWQEFGAADCSLALNDELSPDTDASASRLDLATFVRVGKGTTLEMPPLAATDQVDAEFLKRCRAGDV